MKKSGFNPFILLSGAGGSGEIIGGGSGLGGDKIVIAYSEWPTSGYQYGYDFDGDEFYSWEEYAAWWDDQQFPDSANLWAQTNPGVPYGGPYPAPPSSGGTEP